MKIENYAIKISQKNSVMVVQFHYDRTKQKIIVDLVMLVLTGIEEAEEKPRRKQKGITALPSS